MNILNRITRFGARFSAVAALAFLAGCGPTVKANSQFEGAESLNGKKVVVYLHGHPRLSDMAKGIEERIGESFEKRGITTFKYVSSGLSLSDNALGDFAKEKGADYVLDYGLLGAEIFNMALSGVNSEGSLARVADGKTIWKVSIDYHHPMPGPGAWKTGELELYRKLVAKLTEDGFLK